MKIKNIKGWYGIHKWTSLICTIFLLNLCLTGLPLIFAEEIDQWLEPKINFEALPANTPMTNLDTVVLKAKQKYPAEVIESIFVDDEEPQLFVSMTPSMDADDKLSHTLQFDSRTAKLLRDDPPFAKQPQTFLGLMFSLHVDLFMDLPGELFMGFMGVLFVAAIISGVMLYGPFMKKLNFGTVRYGRSKRLKWLDLHNLTGIVTGVWMFVVGITGVMNELSTPLFSLWQNTEVKQMLEFYKDRSLPNSNNLHSVQAAFDTVRRAIPQMTITSIVYPGSKFGSPYHFLLWAKGNEPLTSRLFSPALVDGRTGSLAAIVKMPVYLRALEVSRPLHFGDYGGLPLKIIWAVFDLLTIIVLVSGIYLWIIHRKSRDAWMMKLVQGESFQQEITANHENR